MNPPHRQSSTRVEADSGAPRTASHRPRKRFGQNFLVDPAAIRRIRDALAPSPGETVLEIGPGRAALTAALLEVMPRITVVEIDRDLADALRARFPAERLRVVEGDVLETSWSAWGAPVVLVGNLPYNISKPVAMRLVEERARIDRAVLTFQREVAHRLTATPGTGAYGPLTVLAGRAFRIERLFDLPAGAFRPRPKVVSTVTRWLPLPAASLPDGLVRPLREALRACFAHRRKTLLTNLRDALPGGEAAARELLARAEIDGRLRAEAIPPDGFVRLAGLWAL